eukprot:TRINITY_DN2152_c0_g4_i1.p1 TRINITY_DN2152_c0_g4~~TRINITY_DN2152_c0_g4_i1.p1  ORF type:complete len:638 (+),score=224.21 TRINITY_DN2152_c0_g4_i1:76-1914(+)
MAQVLTSPARLALGPCTGQAVTNSPARSPRYSYTLPSSPPPPPPPGSLPRPVSPRLALPGLPQPPPPASPRSPVAAPSPRERVVAAQVRDHYNEIDRLQRSEMCNTRDRLGAAAAAQEEALFQERRSRAHLTNAQQQAADAKERTAQWEQEKAAAQAKAAQERVRYREIARQRLSIAKRTEAEERHTREADRKLRDAELARQREAARVARLEATASVGKVRLENAQYTGKATCDELRRAREEVANCKAVLAAARHKLRTAETAAEGSYEEIIRAQRELREATHAVAQVGTEHAHAAARSSAAQLYHAASVHHRAHAASHLLHHADPLAPLAGSPRGQAQVAACRVGLLDAEIAERANRLAVDDAALQADCAAQSLCAAEARLALLSDQARNADGRLAEASLQKARTEVEVCEHRRAMRMVAAREKHMRDAAAQAQEQQAQAAAELARRRASLKRAKDRLAATDKSSRALRRELEKHAENTQSAHAILSTTAQLEEVRRRKAERSRSEAQVAEMRARTASAEAEWAERAAEHANQQFVDAARGRLRVDEDADRQARLLATLEHDNALLQRQRVTHEIVASPARSLPPRSYPTESPRRYASTPQRKPAAFNQTA